MLQRSTKMLYALGFILTFCTACGQEGNIADCEDGPGSVPCSELSDDELAQRAMDEGDYPTAIILLTDLIAEEPSKHERRPRLSAALAASAGFKTLKFASPEDPNANKGSVNEVVGNLVPGPDQIGSAAYDKNTETMAGAVTVLKSIPAAWLAEAPDFYTLSTNFQMALYQTVYSGMLINKFTISPDDGEFDVEQLETMTDAEALAIIASLDDAAEQQSGEQGAKLQEKIADFKKGLDGTGEEGTRDQLVEYLKSQEESG